MVSKLCCCCHLRPRLKNNSYCVLCERERGKRRYRMSREKILKMKKEWAKKNPEKIRKYHRRYNRKIKEKVFELLGNMCNNPQCPIPKDKLDPRSLQLDHINGGGTKERQKITKHYWNYIYEKILNGSKDYQLLCAYCNWMKRFERNEFKKRID